MISLGFCIQRVLGTSMGFFWVPLTELGTRLIFFVCPLSKLCISDAHLRVREKHVLGGLINRGAYIWVDL